MDEVSAITLYGDTVCILIVEVGKRLVSNFLVCLPSAKSIDCGKPLGCSYAGRACDRGSSKDGEAVGICVVGLLYFYEANILPKVNVCNFVHKNGIVAHYCSATARMVSMFSRKVPTRYAIESSLVKTLTKTGSALETSIFLFTITTRWL